MLSLVLIAASSLLALTMGQDTGTSKCYWPDGSEAKGLLPCTQLQQRGEAPCCWQGDYCTSDSYCITAYYRYFYRGACTAQDWRDGSVAACPQTECLQTTDFRSQSVGIVACNDTASACGAAADAAMYCESGPVFTMGRPIPGLEFYTVEAAAQSTPSPSDSTSSSASSSISPSGSLQSQGASTAAGDMACDNGSDRAAVIGLATALGVLGITTLVLGGLLWRNIRNFRQPGSGPAASSKVVESHYTPAFEVNGEDGSASHMLGTMRNGSYPSPAELSAVKPPQEIMDTRQKA
ncbi:hypothetical protein GGR52DRAFT_528022 [Hypoxylon sp. FL1284]|nr:hypothetical protein GGR52DRAFT_528022 [Hypoxylon sp. FL1284]